MAKYKKKTVIFLMAVASFGGIMMVRASAGKDPPSTQSAHNSKITCSPEPLFSEASGFYAEEPNSSPIPNHRPHSLELFSKMMFAALLVIILGTAAIYISKKFLPNITNPPGKKIRVIETVHLGPRKTLHLLKVGNRQLLIGSTAENIARLADVTVALAEIDMSSTEGQEYR